MAVRIRLQRRGNIHRPFYHIVAADSRKKRDGRFLERLGCYNPLTDPITCDISEEKLHRWYALGAQLSNAVHKLIKQKKILLSRKRT